jgi:hypothetical protein
MSLCSALCEVGPCKVTTHGKHLERYEDSAMLVVISPVAPFLTQTVEEEALDSHKTGDAAKKSGNEATC